MFYMQAEFEFLLPENDDITNMSRNSDFVKRGFKSAQSALVDIKQQQPFTYNSVQYWGVGSRVATSQQMQEYGYQGDYDTVIVIVKEDFLELTEEQIQEKEVFIMYKGDKYTIDTIHSTSSHYKIFLKQRS